MLFSWALDDINTIQYSATQLIASVKRLNLNARVGTLSQSHLSVDRSRTWQPRKVNVNPRPHASPSDRRATPGRSEPSCNLRAVGAHKRSCFAERCEVALGSSTRREVRG